MSDTTSLIVGCQASSLSVRIRNLESITEYGRFIQESFYKFFAQHIFLLDFVLENIFERELFVLR